ncbi:MAG TPA: tRNA (guanosine(37)-N1)-methyltransferase TrmD [Kofleriaceae bacterium]|nr:tRNA (guanosine(37)-N1)-methyltransferase TrmD [Kofleriaceae bacterium]
MRFTVVTILPELVTPALSAGVVGRAIAGGVIAVDTVNPRDFTHDKHRTVDDTPYGGGPGMVMKCEPLVAAIESVATPASRRILLTPTGAPLDQAIVRRLANEAHLVLVCGRYEGIDERVAELAIDESISLGDFVLSGGEIAAVAIVDAVARLRPGVLGEPTSADEESFGAGLLEYPQYTRPWDFRGKIVPEILAGGNHAAIRKWRRREALRRTARRRPDLFARAPREPKDPIDAPELDVASRTHIALVHHPIVDRTGAVVTTALTNFDVHDIARSAQTYGLGGYWIVTPVAAQREKADHIARLWQEEGGEHRADALARVRAVPAIADVIAELTARYGAAPLVVVTTASNARFTSLPRQSPRELVGSIQDSPGRPLLILFGTGWGLADTLIPEAERVLLPIRAATPWNHLSVRSAVAVLLDRLFGLAT